MVPGRETRTDMREEQRPLLDPSPGWVSQDRNAAMTVLWFAVGIAVGFAFAWGVLR